MINSQLVVFDVMQSPQKTTLNTHNQLFKIFISGVYLSK